jgi:hypothetical protein
MRVERYSPSCLSTWNAYVEQSKNGTFRFDRRYMEYHADRFEDFSLLFFNESDRLAAIMPASRHGDTVVSHGGLTYGGVVSNEEMKTATMLRLFDSLLTHLRESAISKLVYKPIPHIFHRMPAEEDLYALFINNARLYRREASSAIRLPERIKFAKGKREGVRKAQRAGLQVREAADFQTFFDIGRAVMRDRHNLQPVHTSAEMALLAERFPRNIHLHASFADERMLAGVISYAFPSSVHIQYMYNSDEGLGVGALDIILDFLINQYYSGYNYLSFGVSTEQDGRYLNEGLIHQKEMFGARSIVHDFYEVDIS